MAQPPAASMRHTAANDQGATPPRPSAFTRELERARRHLAKLEAEQERHGHVAGQDPVELDESPTLVRTCNVLIWAVVLAPVLLALTMLAQRLLD